MKHTTQRWSLITVLVAICLTFSTMSAVADDETAASGNGGTGTGAANGGAAALGDIESGSNLGNALGLGDTGGGEISGGSVANSTDLTAALDGGTGIADATGGDDNIAFTLDPVPPAPAPEPGPVPPPPPPVEEFQVCVAVPGATVTCLPGECVPGDEGFTCTIQDCSTIPDVIESPCDFSGCSVTGNTGECVVPVAT